jgi:outer membrane protein assembly factor BamE (lipoprotein component of BamABCDE complex)
MRKVARAHTIPLRLAVGLLLLLFVAGLGTAGVVGHRNSAAGTQFSASLWRHPAGYCTKSPRGRIVEDLVTHRLRPGMQMDRVRSLLGSPDLMTADDVWFYYVSAEHNGFLATCVGLQLNSTNERLQKAFVTRDD